MRRIIPIALIVVVLAGGSAPAGPPFQATSQPAVLPARTVPVLPTLGTTIQLPPKVEAPAVVLPAPPTRIEIPSIGLDAPVGSLATTTNPKSGNPALIPPTDKAHWSWAYWWNQRSAPGSSSAGTTYVVGHSASAVHAVFDLLPRVQSGDTVVLTTPQGRLTYRIEFTRIWPKAGPDATRTQAEFAQNVPNRLVLGTCLHLDKVMSGRNGKPRGSTENFVAFATLVAAEPV